MSNPNFSATVWMNSQIGFDYPILIWQNVNSQFFPDRLDEFPNRVWLPNSDLTKCQIPILPRPFGWISKPGLITQLQFDKVLNPNFFPTIWMNLQTGSDYPIQIWPVSNTNFPRPFGWISRPGLITQLWFDKVSNPNFSSTIWINFQTGSDHPIPIW